MSQDLLTNETHATDVKGTLHTARKYPVNGDELQNIEAGYMFYDDAKEIVYIHDGTTFYGAAASAS